MQEGTLGTVLALLTGAWIGSSCVIYTQEPAATPERSPAQPQAAPPRPGAAPARRPPLPRLAHRTPTSLQATSSAEPGASDDPDSARDAALAASAGPTLPQAPFEEPPEYQGKVETFPPGAAVGRPPGFKPGAPAAYWIWQGPRGSWLLRTTPGGAPHLFRGRITGVSGEIVNVHPLRTEFRDRIRQTRKGWAFSFTTATHADGFTFMTRDGGCVRFDLELEGGPQPKRVIIGHGELQPQIPHFVVCPAGRTP
jgi:hypothetical protein